MSRLAPATAAAPARRAAPLSPRVLARASLVAVAAFAALGVVRARAEMAPVDLMEMQAGPFWPAAQLSQGSAGQVSAAQGSAAQGSGVVRPPPPPAGVGDGFEIGELDASSIPLGGALAPDEAIWQDWKRRFLTDQGRVVDTANGYMSHSEGQGYGMVFAVAAGDRVAFERIWAWTRANMMVRPDELVAWRWEPDKRAGVGDTNNASDGDILIAWALTEAAEFWGEVSYRIAARRIAVEVSRKTFLLKTTFGTLILPAMIGFTDEERSDGPVVNLSYWVFPALERLKIVAPEVDWKGVTQSGLDLLKIASFGADRLPPDWLSLKSDRIAPAQGFPATFGYDAIRVPLYMAMAGIGEREHYAPFLALWRNGAAPRKIDLSGAGPGEPMTEGGYRAPAALVMCATSGLRFPTDLRRSDPAEHYYPATLRLMALAGARMRYSKCL